MAEYRIEFLKTAEKELAKLPKDIQQRVRDRINLLMINPYPPDVKKLKMEMEDLEQELEIIELFTL
jgi:mRNA interferase RelE/StbE